MRAFLQERLGGFVCIPASASGVEEIAKIIIPKTLG